MGMYDEIRCLVPLSLAEFQDLEYQSKDTPAQFLDQYEIRSDGLWHEDYETEDQSEMAMWKKDHPGQEPPAHLRGIGGEFIGMATRVNKRWVKVEFGGPLRFYTTFGQDHTGWIEWEAIFARGTIEHIRLFKYKP